MSRDTVTVRLVPVWGIGPEVPEPETGVDVKRGGGVGFVRTRRTPVRPREWRETWRRESGKTDTFFGVECLLPE